MIWLILILNIIVLIIFYIYFTIQINKKIDTSNFLHKVKLEVADIITELNQTTERNVSIIEFKINTLSKLLNDADKRIKLLNNKIKLDKENSNFVEKDLYTDKIVKPVLNNHTQQLIKSLHIDEEEKTIDISSKKNKDLEKSNNDNKDEDKDLPIKERVANMANNGFSSNKIASILNLSSGEVELILSLSNQK